MYFSPLRFFYCCASIRFPWSRGWVLLMGLLSGLFTSCDNPSERPPVASTHEAAGRSDAIAVRVEKKGHGYQLLRGGQPYFLRGGGGLQQFARLREAGG